MINTRMGENITNVKEDGVQYDDADIVAWLKEIQPDPIDTKGTISPEEVDKIPELQRGECTGTLIDGF